MENDSTTKPSQVSVASLQAVLAENRNWFMALGFVLVVLGVVAVAFPLITTIAAKILLGWLFLIGGSVQVIHAFSTKSWSEFILNLVIGALYVFVGGWLAFFPLTGILTLTVLVAMMFIIQGIIECSMSLRLRPLESWLWMLVSGIIAIVVGILIIGELPSSALWAIGLLVGINMISSGFAYFSLALAAGKI